MDNLAGGNDLTQHLVRFLYEIFLKLDFQTCKKEAFSFPIKFNIFS